MTRLLSDQLIRWSWVGDHLHEIRHALQQHLALTVIAVGVGFAISCVLAAIAIRFRIVYQPINAVAGVMYAVPSLALFILLVPIFGFTALTAEIALVTYTIQILFRSIVAGIDGVPDFVRESATAMGYTRAKQTVARGSAARASGDHERTAHRHRDDGRAGSDRRHPRRRPGRSRQVHLRRPQPLLQHAAVGRRRC